MQNPPADSFFARFQAALRVYGWSLSDWSQLTARNGEVFELRGQLLETRRCTKKSGMGGLCGLVLHALRDDMRLTLFRKASQRRRDMVDLHRVDRKSLQNVFRHLHRETHPSYIILCWLPTAFTVLPGFGLIPSCPYCQSAIEDEVHRFWVCPAWHDIRCSHLGLDHCHMWRTQGWARCCFHVWYPLHDLPCTLKANWVDVCGWYTPSPGCNQPEGKISSIQRHSSACFLLCRSAIVLFFWRPWADVNFIVYVLRFLCTVAVLGSSSVFSALACELNAILCIVKLQIWGYVIWLWHLIFSGDQRVADPSVL